MRLSIVPTTRDIFRELLTIGVDIAARNNLFMEAPLMLVFFQEDKTFRHNEYIAINGNVAE
jgi:hypothetical protein